MVTDFEGILFTFLNSQLQFDRDKNVSECALCVCHHVWNDSLVWEEHNWVCINIHEMTIRKCTISSFEILKGHLH